VDNDIKLFFQTQLASLAKNRSDCDLLDEWPSSSDIEVLCKKAAGFFIYASTVVKFVVSEYDPPPEKLALITSLPRKHHWRRKNLELTNSIPRSLSKHFSCCPCR
jgi:hypothetical protein